MTKSVRKQMVQIKDCVDPSATKTLSRSKISKKEKSNMERYLETVEIDSHRAVEDRVDCYDLVAMIHRHNSVAANILMLKLGKCSTRQISITLKVSERYVEHLYRHAISLIQSMLRMPIKS